MYDVLTENSNAIVVGGGIGGCAIGALLAHKGYNVKLFDKNKTIGGRCTSYTHKGFTIDLGVHIFGSSQHGYLGDVCRMIGMPDAIKWVLSENPTPIMRDLGEEKIASQELIKFFEHCLNMPETEYEKLYYKSLSTFVWKFTKDPTLLTSISGMCGIIFCIPPFEASAGEFIRCFQQLAKTSSSGYPIGGCIAIPRAYTNAMEKFGSSVVLDAPIKKIIIENNQAKGVELKDGTQYFSDLIISNADIQNTVLNLVGEDHFPEDYVKKIKKLRYSMHCITIKVALDKPVTDEKFIMYYPTSFKNMMKDPSVFVGSKDKPPEKLPGMITIPTNFDPNLAPNGKQLIFFGTASIPGLSNYDAWGDACYKSLCECIPEIENHVMWYRTDSPATVETYAGEGGCIIGVSQNIYQVHERRPSQITPINGLYIVGAEAGGHGIGTELAANSAIELFEILKKEPK